MTAQYPQTRGVAVIKVRDMSTGEITHERVEKNVLLEWFQYYLFNHGDSYMADSDYWNKARIFAGNSDEVPSFGARRINGSWEVYASDGDPKYSWGEEEITGASWYQFNNIIQVYGSARSFNRIGIIGNQDSGEDLGISSLSNAASLIALDSPAAQGPTEQIEISYRIYFEPPTGVTNGIRPLEWRNMLMSLHGKNYASDLGISPSNDMYLAQGGTHYDGRINFGRWPSAHSRDNSVVAFRTTSTQTWSSNDSNWVTTDQYRSAPASTSNWSYVNQRWKAAGISFNYLHGMCFNVLGEGMYSTTSGYYLAGKAIPSSEDKQYESEDVSLYASQLTRYYESVGMNAPIIPEEGPFKKAIMHAADDFKVVYNASKLPASTFVPTLSGTWDADDHTPLLSRIWFDNGGLVDSTATYKLSFCRFIGAMAGVLGDADFNREGIRTGEGRIAFESNNIEHQAFQNYGYLQTRFRPHQQHELSVNSPFGNRGQVGFGGYSSNSSEKPVDFTLVSTGTQTGSWANCKKFPGNTMNDWWGWSQSEHFPNRHGLATTRPSALARRPG